MKVVVCNALNRFITQPAILNPYRLHLHFEQQQSRISRTASVPGLGHCAYECLVPMASNLLSINWSI